MRKGSYKLNEFHIEPDNNKVALVEIYESLSSGNVYSRIYTTPTNSEIPTVSFGPLDDIGKIGYRDNVPIHPYKGLDEIKTNSQNLSLYELRKLPGLEQIFENVQRLFYVVRPSSFLLTHAWNTSYERSVKRIKIYSNKIDK